MNKQIVNGFMVLISVVIFGFVLLSHIDSLTIRKWDEARNAINAWEMKETGFSIVTTWQYRPDHWNTKPPLLIWMQSLFLSIFGRTEIAIRLPSILAGFSLIPFFYLLRKRLSLNIKHVFLVLAIFISFPLITEVHCYRTGDYDALLTSFMIMYSITYYIFLKHDKIKYFYWFIVFLILAFLTKGIAAMLFLPGLVIFTLLNKKVLSTLKKPAFYIGIFIFLTVVLSYYLGRDSIDPGYIRSVMRNELGGRFLRINENHSRPWFFYFHHLFTQGAGLWILILPVALLYVIKRKMNSLTVFSLILVLTHMTVITISQTKLDWYYLPNMMFFSIIISDFIYRSINFRFSKLLVLLLIIIVPVVTQINKVSRVHNRAFEYNDFVLSRFIRENQAVLQKYGSLKIIDQPYYENTRFYTEGIDKYSFTGVEDLEVSDTILYNSNLHYDQIGNKYIQDYLYSYDHVIISVIKGKKEEEKAEN